MDVRRNTRDRVFSILNDNDCPSFVHRQKQSSPSPTAVKLPSISSFASFSPRLERPNLHRQPQFSRKHSVSSAGSPPLLRHDSSSSSSSKSSSSMDSTPSPITPAYNYNDNSLVPYDNLMRQDPTMSMNFLPSPTGITPFVEQAMMIGPISQGAYHPKVEPVLVPAAYPIIPAPLEMVQIPTPSLSTNPSMDSASSLNPQSQTSPSANTGNTTSISGKKNKYPCPYAQSHNCSATFTTSGHAARHGKKHTGEKGVHCPVCDKAFTRKDNMKQHERTHKNRPANGEDKKSKAQITRDANKVKDAEEEEAISQPDHQTRPIIQKSSSGHSAPSDITLAPNPVDTPTDISPAFFPDTNPQIVAPGDATLTDPMASLYPPLADEAMLQASMVSPDVKPNISIPQPPTLVRGFSDLDTLAQAADSLNDPYFPHGQF